MVKAPRLRPLARFARLCVLCAAACVVAACSTPEVLVRLTDDSLLAADRADLPPDTPGAVGMDPALLAQALAELPAPAEHGLRSLLVLRHGRLVLEQYWNGHDAQTQQDIRSATKSITALLVGVAIERGLLAGVDEPLARHLAAAYPGAPALQADLRLRELLTMHTGRACDDRDPASPGQEDRMYLQRDWVAHFLHLPPAADPGQGRYCTGGVVTLGRVLAEASGQAVPALADAVLFAPLGIRQARWSRFDDGRQTDTGGHLHLRPRDMARIGQLVLQQGVWQGRALVPAEWIAQATAPQARIDGGRPYGYLWWPGQVQHQGRALPAVLASGNGGQFIVVVPALQLVMVATGGNYNDARAQRPMQLLTRYIVPAVRDPGLTP